MIYKITIYERGLLPHTALLLLHSSLACHTICNLSSSPFSPNQEASSLYPTRALGRPDPTVPTTPAPPTTVKALLPHMAAPCPSVTSCGASFSSTFFLATCAEDAGSLRLPPSESCTSTHTHTHIQAHIHINTSTYTSTHIHTHICMHKITSIASWNEMK